MQKKIISIILSVSIVLLTVVPCFATEYSTGSAIRYNDTKSVSDVKADGETNKPYSSSFIEYWYTGSQIQSTSGTMTTWGQLITSITDSIARSVQSLKTAIVSLIDGVETNQATANNYLNTLVSYLTYSGYTVGHSLYDIDVNSLYTYDKLSDLYDLIDAGGLVDKVKIDDNSDNDFTKAYIWNKPNLSSIQWLGENYAKQTSSYAENWSVLGTIIYNLYFFNRSLANLGVKLEGGMAASVGNITNSDLTTSQVPYTSIWYDIRTYGTNFSSYLARLAFVLASDEEIEARQAAASNQDSVVDNFIKPTGTGSASASDFADVAAAGSSIKDALDSNVSAGNAFTSLDSNSDAWNWFSQSTLNSLDSSSSQNRKSANSDTPLLDNYYSDLMETLRFK